MYSNVEEIVTATEYARARYRMAHATSENERIQMESVVRWLSKKLDSFRRKNDARVQANEKEDSTRGVSNMRSMRWQNNESR